MSREFQDLMLKIEKVIANRTISLPARRAKDYEDGTYKPFFSLIDRDGELLCMWCSNRRKPDEDGKGGDVEILRIREPERGFFSDSQDPLSWNEVTAKVMRHFGWKC